MPRTKATEPKTVGRLLTVEELAELLHVEISCIYAWRSKGKGPRGIRPEGGRVLFRESDVDAWLKNHADPVSLR